MLPNIPHFDKPEKTITHTIDAQSFIRTVNTTVGEMKQNIKNWLMTPGSNVISYTIEHVMFSDGSILTPEVLLTNKYDNVNFLGQQKILPGAKIVIKVTMKIPDIFKEFRQQQQAQFSADPANQLNSNDIAGNLDQYLLSQYLLQVTGRDIYFDDVDMVEGDRTVMRNALTDGHKVSELISALR